MGVPQLLHATRCDVAWMMKVYASAQRLRAAACQRWLCSFHRQNKIIMVRTSGRCDSCVVVHFFSCGDRRRERKMPTGRRGLRALLTVTPLWTVCVRLHVSVCVHCAVWRPVATVWCQCAAHAACTVNTRPNVGTYRPRARQLQLQLYRVSAAHGRPRGGRCACGTIMSFNPHLATPRCPSPP